MDRRTAIERMRIARIEGAGSERYYVDCENFFQEPVHQNSHGWFWSYEPWVLKPYSTSQDAIAALREYYAGFDIDPGTMQLLKGRSSLMASLLDWYR
jgi:hypothetical protein